MGWGEPAWLGAQPGSHAQFQVWPLSDSGALLCADQGDGPWPPRIQFLGAEDVLPCLPVSARVCMRQKLLSPWKSAGTALTPFPSGPEIPSHGYPEITRVTALILPQRWPGEILLLLLLSRGSRVRIVLGSQVTLFIAFCLKCRGSRLQSTAMPDPRERQSQDTQRPGAEETRLKTIVDTAVPSGCEASPAQKPRFIIPSWLPTSPGDGPQPEERVYVN